MKWSLILLLSSLASAQLTESIVTGSRALSTVYQNTTGKPMIMYASIYGTGTGGGSSVTAALFTDGSNPPTTQTSANHSDISPNSTLSTNLFALIPPSNYYKITATASGTPSVGIWIETTIDDVGSTATQNVVTGSRAIGTIYHNASATDTIWVSVTCNSSAGDACTALTDGAATPTTVIGHNSCQTGGNNCPLFFPVLPLYYYQITRGGDATITSWVETTTVTPLNMAESTPTRTIAQLPAATTYSAGNSAILATVSADNVNIATGSLYGLHDTSNPTSTYTSIQSRKPSEGQFVFMAVPTSYFYAVSADIPNDTNTNWAEWAIPGLNPTFAGEKKRRASN